MKITFIHDSAVSRCLCGLPTCLAFVLELPKGKRLEIRGGNGPTPRAKAFQVPLRRELASAEERFTHCAEVVSGPFEGFRGYWKEYVTV